MTYKDRLYKRTAPTSDRKQEQQALMDSNLVGLCLSDKLDLAAVEHSNLEHTRKETRPKIPKPRSFTVVKSSLNDEEKGTVMKSIMESTSLGAPMTEDTIFQQNYGVFIPVNPLGCKVFVHGRDLFSPDAAERYFAPGADKDAFPYEAFSETAKDKIRHAFSHESYEGRILDYGWPGDPAELMKKYFELIQAEFPAFKAPVLPEVTHENLMMVSMEYLRAMEAQGLAVEELTQRTRFPTPERLALEKARVQEYCEKYLDETMARLGDGVPARYHDELHAYLKQRDYDPEIVDNFSRGIASAGTSFAPLEDVLQAGIESRTEDIVRSLAKAIANPYDEKFIRAEKIVTDNMVHSVHPRVLRNALRKKTVLLITDHDNLAPLSHVLGVDGSLAMGKYHPKNPAASEHTDDFVMAAIPQLQYDSLAMILRHEFQHHHDLSSDSPFVVTYKGMLEQCLTEDRRQLNGTHDFLQNLGDLILEGHAPSKTQLKELKRLAELRGVPAGDLDTSPDAVAEVRAALLQDVEKVRHWVRCTFLPEEGEETLEMYNLKFSHMLEMPAVIEQVRGMVGRDFAAELLPRLHEAVVYHRLQNENLRD